MNRIILSFLRLIRRNYTRHYTHKYSRKLTALVLFSIASCLQPNNSFAAKPADPTEVKLRYMVLLGTFVRGQTQGDSACILDRPDDYPEIKDIAPKISFTTNVNALSHCKSVFIPKPDNLEPQSLQHVLAMKNVLLMSDHSALCKNIDVLFFQDGKRIFFNIDTKALKPKTFSLAAQVLALSKKFKCSGNE